MLAGIPFEHDALRQVLTDRCRRLVVIISKSFLTSPQNEFISKLAQSQEIKERNRKIVPCIVADDFKVPDMFNHYHPLNYGRASVFNNFWEKLRYTLAPTADEYNAESDYFHLMRFVNLVIRI